MQQRRSTAIVTACMFGGWLWSVAPVVAQRAQPSLSVVTFEGTGAPRDARDAMADELAARLVDTGHFRVLHREWLPHEGAEVPTLDVLRAAAQSVNVDYLILGTIRQSTRVPPPQSSVMASRGFSPAVGRPILLPLAAPPQRVRQQTTVIVSVRVVDVTTADVVRTATAQREYFSNAGSPAPYLTPVASRPATVAAAIATMAARPKARSTRLTKDWRQAVQEVALQLDARGVPASGQTPARAQDAMPGTVQDGGVPAARPTMTVADFDTDRTGWMPPPRLGTTLAEMLTDRLVATGQYRMMDREWLVSAQDGRVPFPQLVERAAGAGVDYLVAGSVTRLSIENHSFTGGGAVPLPLIGALIHKHKTESVIGLTIRVIDVRTGEVVATSMAEKGATQKNTAGGGVIVIGPVPVFGAAGSSSTGFHDRLLDTAVQEAVTAAADKIVAAASRLVRSSK